MKRLALFAILAACLGLSALAESAKELRPTKLTHAVESQRPSRPSAESSSKDCGGRGQPPCPEEPPPDDPPDDPLQPYPSGPACDSHDATIWHGVWNYELGCHYDHHHGIDPSTTPFADRVAAWDSLFEGELHEGYKFLFFESPDGGCRDSDGFGEGCVLAFLLRLHDAGTVKHMTTRRHSNRVIALVSNAALTQFGVVETGLLTDYGVTHCPYKKEQCELADDPWTMEEAGPDLWEQAPYRAAHVTDELDRIVEKGLSPQFWQSLGPNNVMFEFFDPVPNRNLQLAWSAADAWGLINRADYASGNPSENFISPDFTHGGFNHSLFCVFNLRVILPPGVGAGFSGYTDDFGRLNSNCSALGPNCWPLKVAAGTPIVDGYNWSVTPLRTDCSTVDSNEFDVCFDGAGAQVDCRLGGTSAGWLRPPGH